MRFIFLFYLTVLFSICTLKGQQQLQHVEIPNFMSFYVTQPPNSNLCWAACDAMLLRSQDVNATVVDMSVKAFGIFKDQGAGPDLSMPSANINGNWTTGSGTSVQINSSVSNGVPAPPLNFNYQQFPRAAFNPGDDDLIITSLQAGHPVVIASVNHGRVCVRADYVLTPAGDKIVGLWLLNPEPGTGLEKWPIEKLGNQMTLQERGYLGLISF